MYGTKQFVLLLHIGKSKRQSLHGNQKADSLARIGLSALPDTNNIDFQ